jgi:hypothetical protein
VENLCAKKNFSSDYAGFDTWTRGTRRFVICFACSPAANA